MNVAQGLMTHTQFDAIIVDAGFFGILPFLLGDRARPPVLAYGTPPVGDQQPRHRPQRQWPATLVERIGAAAQPRAEPVVAEGHAKPIEPFAAPVRRVNRKSRSRLLVSSTNIRRSLEP